MNSEADAEAASPSRAFATDPPLAGGPAVLDALDRRHLERMQRLERLLPAFLWANLCVAAVLVTSTPIEPSQDAHASSQGALSRTEDARARLERVPEGFVRDLTAQRTEARATRLGHSRITREVVEDQFASWQEHSELVQRTMVWEAGAYELIAAAPAVVRGMIVREIEAGARDDGLDEVSTEYVEAARAQWRERGIFHVAPTREY